MTEFESQLMSKYLVGTWLSGNDKPRCIEFTMSISKLLWVE